MGMNVFIVFLLKQYHVPVSAAPLFYHATGGTQCRDDSDDNVATDVGCVAGAV